MLRSGERACNNNQNRKAKNMKLSFSKSHHEGSAPAPLFQFARRVALSAPGKFLLAVATLAAILVFTLLSVSSVPGQAQAQPGQQDGSESKIQQGFAIAPVPLDLRGKNRAL